jgi:MarR-like DNA-binding transcriptional regulator SgrR of sgrS sRNA
MHNTLKQCVPLLTCAVCRLPRQLCQLCCFLLPRAHAGNAYALSTGRFAVCVITANRRRAGCTMS